MYHYVIIIIIIYSTYAHKLLCKLVHLKLSNVLKDTR